MLQGLLVAKLSKRVILQRNRRYFLLLQNTFMTIYLMIFFFFFPLPSLKSTPRHAGTIGSVLGPNLLNVKLLMTVFKLRDVPLRLSVLESSIEAIQKNLIFPLIS